MLKGTFGFFFVPKFGMKSAFISIENQLLIKTSFNRRLYEDE